MPPKRVPKDVKIWNADLTRAAEFRYAKAGEDDDVDEDVSTACVLPSLMYASVLLFWSCSLCQLESIGEMKMSGEKPRTYLRHHKVFNSSAYHSHYLI